MAAWFADWASEGMVDVRAGGGPAADAFLTADLQRFAAAAGVLSPRSALGVMGPGMDSTGRLYPFLIACEPAVTLCPERTLDANDSWFEAVESAYLAALASDFDLSVLGTLLAGIAEPKIDVTLTSRGTVVTHAGAEPLWFREAPKFSAVYPTVKVSALANGLE